jgi:hypothetical protein
MPATNLIRLKISLCWFSQMFRQCRCTLRTISFGSSHSSFFQTLSPIQNSLSQLWLKKGEKIHASEHWPSPPCTTATRHGCRHRQDRADTVRWLCIVTPVPPTCRSAATRSVKFSYRMNWKIVWGGGGGPEKKDN